MFALLLVLCVSLGTDAARAVDAGNRAARALVWHVATPAGEVVDSRDADRPINPASIVKLATTLRALESLGPDHRFETRFAVSGPFDRERGRVEGDLIVIGGADPDFQPENAFLVAETLARLGIREVAGALRVDARFWIGWEGGSERHAEDAERRALRMAARLRDAWEPERWSSELREIWSAFVRRRHPGDGDATVGAAGAVDEATPTSPTRIRILKGLGVHRDDSGTRVVAVHRSNPIAMTLKRLNAYSNNDIERLEASVGSATELARLLTTRWDADPRQVGLSTLSGLGRNRLTPRLIVRLLADLRAACARHGLRLGDVLPIAGCDPGTLEQLHELRKGGLAAGAFTGKTGTLIVTDGGVAVLAGSLSTADGELLILVAHPRSGSAVRAARRAEGRWLADLLARHGGPRPDGCGAPVVYSDLEARVTTPVSR